MNTTLEKFVGKILYDIQITRDDDDIILFQFVDGTTLKMYHESDCCESVYIEDVVGDPTKLVIAPIVKFDEKINQETEEWGDSTTYTFYTVATTKGYLDIRWCGSSNGYYSESVDFEILSHTVPDHIKEAYPEHHI